MYLKRITAQGFKSFADKINMEFNNGVIGVVGPNGSGKSNIVDAVRWVLGEQSVKSLRGDGNMTDVIFSGSKSRHAMNCASVTLTFDNSDHYLPLDYDEVSIRRRVYRDGTNEYHINGEKCRLKDVTNILLDTGVAKESFNIISQGKIEEIISSKPSDRRVMFEEAAGVLKYKKRKEEALRKLERTHENMHRVNDVMTELESQIEPLREQRDKALIYQNTKKELEQIEVAVITSEITSINNQYQENKHRIEVLENEIITLSTNNSESETQILEYKKKIDEVEQSIMSLQNQLIQITTKVEKINGEKNIILERKKYEVEDQKLHERSLELKEKELSLTNEVAHLSQVLSLTLQEVDTIKNNVIKKETQIKEFLQKKKETEQALSQILNQERHLQNQVDHLRNAMEENHHLPMAVKNVLNHPTLQGIRNVIGNVIEVEEKYALAISTVLGAASNYVIVDSEQDAKAAIRYLKETSSGRVTFFPRNIIKSKNVDSKTLHSINSMEGFVGVASKLVQTEPDYLNIIENQLGNVLVVDTLDHATTISKQIEHRYRIVTLDGELLHVGGSLTGGKQKIRNVIQDKYELENLLRKQKQLTQQQETLENQMNEWDHELKSIEDELYLQNKDLLLKQEEYKMKIDQQNKLQLQLENIKNETSSIKHMLDRNLSAEEEQVLERFYQAEQQKEELTLTLEQRRNEKRQLQEELDQYEFSVRQENSMVREKNKELKELEIEVNRADVKLDHLLSTLTETYSMTYEKAVSLYELEEDITSARTKVSNLKRTIKNLGNVNVGAIEEFDRVNERFSFLSSQKEDLLNAENTLLEIIQEMDQVMQEEFSTTFETIRKHFNETFQELFHGGHADLKLTDPKNILETGIEIVASPPGKKLTSISLLSGGEKTFTAISLLFSILKSRPVPFCILDEVEAALDEVNVDSFGQYVKKLKEKTQFILITHKKKTMEYADILYGITMQESGVSKLVSVKLEDIKE